MISNARREFKRLPAQKRRLATDEISNVPEGEIRKEREINEHHCRHFEALLHPEGQFGEASACHRRETDRLLQAETATVATPQLSLTKDNEFTFMNSQSNQHKHSRSPDSRSSRRISRWYLKSHGVVRTLEIESHSKAAAQLQGFEQTRDYHQRSLKASNEEYRKYHNMCEEYQDERYSIILEFDVFKNEKDS